MDFPGIFLVGISLQGELWLPVPHILFMNFYMISNYGRVFSHHVHRIKAPIITKEGYKKIVLSARRKRQNLRIHRLVALAFNKKPENMDVVNHLDGNKMNNKSDNLQWTNHSGNSQHAHDNDLVKNKGKKVVQYDLSNNVIKVFNSMIGAGKELGVSYDSIYSSCNYGKLIKSSCYFKYHDEEAMIKHEAPIDGEEIITHPNYSITPSGAIYSKTYKRYLSTEDMSSGYPAVGLYRNGVETPFFVHILVATYFVRNDDPINNTVVNHKDGHRDNFDMSNLEWITQSQNCAHVYKLDGSRLHSVLQTNLDDTFVAVHKSLKTAGDALGKKDGGSSIGKALKKGINGVIGIGISYDYKWKTISYKEYERINSERTNLLNLNEDLNVKDMFTEPEDQMRKIQEKLFVLFQIRQIEGKKAIIGFDLTGRLTTLTLTTGWVAEKFGKEDGSQVRTVCRGEKESLYGHYWRYINRQEYDEMATLFPQIVFYGTKKS